MKTLEQNSDRKNGERDSYETLTNDYTAEVWGGTIEGVSATLKTELVYTGTPQQLVESVTGNQRRETRFTIRLMTEPGL